ncbi:galactose-3-O-sulfotransferase 3-like [Babylonia areolata]|uniref:galactose-3-O-sulfotransferase 3-like n=1 Tax=Babylonia areolata TaxID=304850 RepID=UPI003FCF3985
MAQVVYPFYCTAPGYLMKQKLAFVMILMCCAATWMVTMERLERSGAATITGTRGIRDLWNKLPDGDTSLDSLASLEQLVNLQPRQHVFFLNTHKAGGSIVRNVLLLFAHRNNLTVLLPRKGLGFSFSSKNYWHNRDTRSSRNSHIICDYLVFNKTFVDAVLPADTLFVGIVRHPFHQFLAAFHKYTRVLPDSKNYLRKIPGPFPVATYLSEPEKWEHPDPSRSFTNNRMSFDFGLEVAQWKDNAAVERYLQYLESTFHLVMVAEKFDESLVLLRRLARWSLRDVLYLQVSDFEMLNRYTFNETQRHRHRKFQYPDYALYARFEAILFKRISEQTQYGFYSELAQFRKTREAVQVFCEKAPEKRDLRVKASLWNEAFRVTPRDCQFMSGVLPLVNRSLLAKNYNYQYYKEETQLLFGPE